VQGRYTHFERELELSFDFTHFDGGRGYVGVVEGGLIHDVDAITRCLYALDGGW
jgi:hypothetical protein